MGLGIALALGALIGISLGLIGGGGSILAVPVLTYVAGVEGHQAITMSLLIVGASALMGSFGHHSDGNLDLRTALSFGLAGVPSAWLASAWSKLFPAAALLLAFGALMLVVGGIMIWRSLARNGAAPRQRPLPVLLLAGVGVGLLTGFLGVGGGFVIVPALVFLGGLPMRRAVGTSLLVIAINAAVGFTRHLMAGSIPWGLTLAFTGVACAGSLLGKRYANRVSQGTLQRMFGVFVIFVGLFMVGRNLVDAGWIHVPSASAARP